VVESPTYVGALQAGMPMAPVHLGSSDENGMITDELEKALRIGPKFIYVLPNFQNRAGLH